MAKKLSNKISSKDNVLLDSLESSKEYTRIMELTEKALQEQWHDLLYSGVINTIFANYKKFFIKKRGQPIKIKKAEGGTPDLNNLNDINNAANDSLLGDKIILGAALLNMPALLAFINKSVDKNIKSVGSYYHFRTEWENYLKKVANTSGQDIINKIPTFKALNFRLSNKEFKDKIKNRVNDLIRGLDKTTKARIASNLIKGIKSGERKSSMINNLTKIGGDISKARAKRIVMTETAANSEFMRYETAKLNGVRVRTWHSVEDSRVCPICFSLDGKSMPIGNNYTTSTKDADFKGLYPPIHSSCRCFLSYEVEGNLASDFVDAVFARNIHEDINNLFQKATQDKPLYTPVDLLSEGKIINPNAIWAGGESLVGPDKNVGNYKEMIIKYPNYRERMNDVLRTKENKLLIDIEGFMIMSGVDELLLKARKELTDEGFVQLIRSLPSKNT